MRDIPRPGVPHLVLVESNTTGSGRAFCAAARDRGTEPVLLSRDPDRYPYVARDGIAAVTVDTADRAAVLRACRGLPGPVAGVTSSSEYFVATAAAAARSLCLPAPDPHAVDRTRAKARQRAALAAAGVPVPAFHEVASVPAGVAAARAVIAAAGRAVVKPVLGSGSDGVRLCARADEAESALIPLLAGRTGARALVESYLEGPEYSVETFDGRVVGITAKHLGPHPLFLETGHEYPAPLPGVRERALAETALAALAALGLGWGPAHVEIRLTAAGPRVVEVNPRLAGGMIPALVRAATGVDLVGAAVDRVLGHRPGLAPDRSGAAAIRFLFAAEPGTVLAAFTGAAADLPGVVSAVVTAREGDRIEITRSFRDRIGHVIALGRTAAEAAARAQEAVGALAVLTAGPEPAVVPAD
ncbi:ATP-grasp domain-containing protein [Nocardiopsis sp. CC223A]|uniref:ATP-grasp domain-containing protein n=1 Tax=Nocardiopsis sp. CC223A TaxID=3044051 RepID=UPI00279584CF|nr:ATP-grasp domain-containing protein [Nocardiopsis sp. CC223A]